MRLQRLYGITDIDQCVIDYCKDIYDATITEFTIQNHTYPVNQDKQHAFVLTWKY